MIEDAHKREVFGEYTIAFVPIPEDLRSQEGDKPSSDDSRVLLSIPVTQRDHAANTLECLLQGALKALPVVSASQPLDESPSHNTTYFVQSGVTYFGGGSALASNYVVLSRVPKLSEQQTVKGAIIVRRITAITDWNHWKETMEGSCIAVCLFEEKR